MDSRQPLTESRHGDGRARVGLVGATIIVMCLLVAQPSAAGQTRPSGAARRCFRQHGVVVVINGALRALRAERIAIAYKSVFVAGFRDAEPARGGGRDTHIHPTAFIVYEPTPAAARQAATAWATTITAREGLHLPVGDALRRQHFEYHGRVFVQWDGNNTFPTRSPDRRIVNLCLGPITAKNG